MPLQVPRLDDRRFDQLVEEGEALVPRRLPAWTDRNPSDAGITLIELFAYLVEASLYQLDRVPERSLAHFAALLGVERTADEPVAAALARAFEAFSERSRAIRLEDVERLALDYFRPWLAATAPSLAATLPPIGRASARLRLRRSDLYPPEPVVALVVLPDLPGDPAPLPPAELRRCLYAFLAGRRLIATRIEVVEPLYTEVRLRVTVVAKAGGRRPADLEGRLEAALRRFLDPLVGGAGSGWPLGRPLFRSELYELLEGVPGVDHVAALELDGPTAEAAPARAMRLPLASEIGLPRLDGLSVRAVAP